MSAALAVLVACDNRRAEFVSACERKVEQSLVSPATAKYGALKDTFTNTNLGSGDADGYLEVGGFQTWLGFVDAENAFGAPVRYLFACQQAPGEAITLVMADGSSAGELEDLLQQMGR